MSVPKGKPVKRVSGHIGTVGSVAPRAPRGRPRAAPATASAAARRQAAAILEVLAGARRPDSAANALGISLPTYFKLEQRALNGLLAACEPRSQGRVPRPESRIAALEKQVALLERECGRQQALVRAAQRTVGLTPAASPSEKGPAGKGPSEKGKAVGRKGRPRRPTVRALRAAKALQEEGPLSADSSGRDGPQTVPPGENSPVSQAAEPCGVPGEGA